MRRTAVGCERVEGGRVRCLVRRYAHEDVVELAYAPLHSLVMVLDEIAEPYGSRSDEEGDPASLSEFLIHGDGENGDAQGETRKVDRKVLLPLLFPLPVSDEEAGHAELGEGKREEDVDRVHDHEGGDGAFRIDEKEQGCHSHEGDAVLHGEALGERREAPGKPRVDRHVRHDPRSVYEARLGGHEEERPFGEDSDEGEDVAQRPVREHGACEDGVECPSLLRGWTPQRR